ncbi:MAG: tetratricopeptide repeat protein [Magnetococcales bacterium]|nr:tetratricopeptide repeat protein [Magnetococcales bacterium]MBF0323060.1 tetratricopeptide repeat protein [Magnetococcales bacterium]
MGQEEIIFREVDEQLEAEQLSRFLRRYGSSMIVGLIIFFAGLVAYVVWSDHRVKRDQAISDLFMSANQAMMEKHWDAAQGTLQKLLDTYPGHGYTSLARLLLARSLVESGRPGDALKQLDTLAADAAHITPLSDAALMEAAWIAADIDLVQARSYLARIGAESTFRVMAMELEGVMSLHDGDKEKALAKFRQALDTRPAPPEGVRQRLLRRVERLGGPVAVDKGEG